MGGSRKRSDIIVEIEIDIVSDKVRVLRECG